MKTQEAVPTETDKKLAALNEMARHASEEVVALHGAVESASEILRAKEVELSRAVSRYGELRLKILTGKIRERGLARCTECGEFFPTDDETKHLFLLEGTDKVSCGYQNSCYGFENFSNLHLLCPACQEEALASHGTVGPYDKSAEGQMRSYAFRVEKREDGYWAHKFGKWLKLKDPSLPGMQSYEVDKLAEEYDLPPKIEVTTAGLVVHKRRAAAAKAA